MTDRVHVTIPGPPVPWQRARPRKDGRGFVNTKAMRQYARHVRSCAQSALLAQHRGRWDPQQVCEVELRIFFPDLRARDEDNVEKLVKDACQGVLWTTDRWTQFRRIVKVPALDRVNPRIELVVTRV